MWNYITVIRFLIRLLVGICFRVFNQKKKIYIYVFQYFIIKIGDSDHTRYEIIKKNSIGTASSILQVNKRYHSLVSWIIECQIIPLKDKQSTYMLKIADQVTEQ